MPQHSPGPQDRLTGLRAGRGSGRRRRAKDFPGTMGRPEAADAAVDSARAAVLPEGLRAGRIRCLTMPEYTAARGRHDHATFRERADASVRCSGFEAKLPHADRPTRHGPGIAMTFSGFFFVTLAY
jgi:hypothetical protein